MSNPPEDKPGRPGLHRNWFSLAGMVIAGASFFAFLLLFALDFFSKKGNPYMGILAYLVAPGFTFLGVSLMALGHWLQLRHERRTQAGAAHAKLTIDLARPRDRKLLAGFVAGTIGFLFLTALGSYETYHYTESVQFCGQACHTPMEPQFVTYQNSAHARVDCVECHVGSGAGAYVKTKINGVRQLACMILENFDRPIHATRDRLRTTQETCEQCHWPNKFSGNLERTHHRFLADETNTQYTVRLLLNVGGGDPTHGPVGGIHWHMNLANKVEYIAASNDTSVIPWVRLTSASGEVSEFSTPDFKGDPAKHKVRTMDCIDCHNRPAHRFRSPNDAVDLALSTGRIDPSIPWVKSNMVATLIRPYQTADEGLQKIAATLRDAYPSHPKVDTLVAESQSIYRHNFFPGMKADWRAYPEHLSHKEWAGCFRCHDGKHKTADGKRSIKASDCNSCHIILAQGSGAEVQKLSSKGHDFIHVDAPYSDFDCHKCHTGAFPKE
jgi:nitrate/TMAO reductase-like tetraheme cytochrome c subunit